jgi:hypothetical protein
MSKRAMTSKEWKKTGHSNFVNLCFFESRNVVGTLIINGKHQGRTRSKWPFFSIRPTAGELLKCVNVIDGFSGSHELVVDYTATRFKNTKFSRRRCQRTCIGVNSQGCIVIFVSTGINLNDAAKRMQEIGCSYAVNADGGSSTMLTKSGKHLCNTSRKVPVILSWKETNKTEYVVPIR